MDVDHKNANATNGDNFSSNATDVTDLQREKAQVELQMLRLKSNINAIEFQLNHNERVSETSSIFFSSCSILDFFTFLAFFLMEFSNITNDEKLISIPHTLNRSN